MPETSETDRPSLFKDAFRWATTPPQAYVIYLIAFLVVAFVSFFVGTLKPKRVAPAPQTQLELYRPA
jgi:hypothetical protein